MTEQLNTMSYEQIIEMRENIGLKKEELENAITALNEEMLFRLANEKVDGKIVGDYSIKKAVRVSFKTTVAEAEQFGATKTAVDTEVLKKLYAKGAKIPNVQTSTYLSVRKLKKDEDEVIEVVGGTK